MILIDVNVLVEAAHRDAARHEQSAGWLSGVLAGPQAVGLPDAVLTGCLRILTHRKVFADPMSASAALQYVAALRSAPAARDVTASEATWQQLASLVDGDPVLRGNLVPDAWLAALALSHGAALVTRDRGFSRFPKLRVLEPGAG